MGKVTIINNENLVKAVLKFEDYRTEYKNAEKEGKNFADWINEKKNDIFSSLSGNELLESAISLYAIVKNRVDSLGGLGKNLFALKNYLKDHDELSVLKIELQSKLNITEEQIDSFEQVINHSSESVSHIKEITEFGEVIKF